MDLTKHTGTRIIQPLSLAVNYIYTLFFLNGLLLFYSFFRKVTFSYYYFNNVFDYLKPAENANAGYSLNFLSILPDNENSKLLH